MSDLGSAIAIVGLSLRFPKANTPDEFWKNLVEGRDCAQPLERDALIKLGVSRDKLDSPEYVWRTYDLDHIDQFDAKFFGISPREARMADPQMRLMLEAAHECIEDSGHVLQGTNTGLYFGVADHKYWLYHNLYQSALEEENEVAKRIYAFKDFFATQLSHKLDLTGPSISLYSACSTALLAVHEACNHLLMFDCDYALAGGCEILQGAGYKYVEGGLSARDGYVRAFDKDASGTVFGSGVGVVALRRLSDAVEDGDRIYAVLRSTAVNNDGNQKVGYIAPGVKGQMGVIHEAIERAGISAREVSYVEAHGTGTKVGDPIEIESISKVYRKYTNDKQFCAIGSVKTNVGHLSIAAGAASLIKTALMLHHKKIPPILHFSEANPAIDFENSPFYVNCELRDWHVHNGRRIAGVSAFGVGGTNVHAVLEQAPTIVKEVEPRPYHRLFVFGAKSPSALARMRERLAEYLRGKADLNLADVAFSLNVGRQKYDHRGFVVADSIAALIEACEKPGTTLPPLPNQGRRQLVFMFPGQGSQYANMALDFYRDEPDFRATVDQCCQHLASALGIDLMPILLPALGGGEGAEDRINQTQYTQLALFVVSYAMARLFMQWGATPQAMIGHSIGEYVAACLAGVFSLNDALKLVAHRGRLMQSMPAGSMLSVPRPLEQVQPLLDAGLSVAGENSPASCVISGPTEAIDLLKAKLALEGVKANLLHTSHAFHSPMMEPILEAYTHIVREAELREPSLPFVSNLTGTWITAQQATDPAYWAAQLRQAVLFSRGLQTLVTQDSVLVEMGPGSTLCSLAGQHEFERDCFTINTLPRAKDETSATDAVLFALGKACCFGVEIDWQAVYGKSGGRRVSLPTYPFERKSYWIDEEQLNRPRAAQADAAPLDHPLLGRRVVATSKVVVFENVLDKETPKFIADHRLVETVIFPGAGYTQLALEVGKHFIKNKKIKVDDIRFAQTLMLHDGVKKVVQTIATANGEGCTFEILSRTLGKSEPGDSSAWVLHAKGRISPHSAKPGTLPMPAIAANAAAELLPLSRYYDALKFITFGPSFRAIRRLWIGETAQGELESLGLVELPAHLYPEVDSYSFHPVLLDAAFQVIDGPKISQTGTLPVGLRNFTVYDAVPNSFYVHAVRREHADEEYSIGEITVFSEQGGIIATIEHYLQKEIADSIGSQDPLADIVFDLQWEKAEVPQSAPAGAGAWVLLGAAEPFGDALAAALAQSGREMLRLGGGLVSDAAETAAVLERVRGGEIDSVVFARPLTATGEQAEALPLSLELLGVVQQLAACDSAAPPRLAIVTRGAQWVQCVQEDAGVDERAVHAAALWGFGNSIAAERPELRCVRIDLDASDMSLAAAVTDLVQGETPEDQLAYRAGQRYVPRLLRHADAARNAGKLRLPHGPFEVRLSRFGTFDNFTAREFIPDLLGDNDVLVEMRSAALNFKETLYVLGFLNPNNRQATDFDFGMEGAGRIKRVGAKITHLAPGDDVIVWHNGCLSSDFVVSAQRVIRKPAALSYAEAACIPTVFMTAYYALYHLARIQRGNRVLIHAAAGGVGQVAIQIAQAVGAEVFATASQGKWAHLERQGVRHVFDSRTLDFAERIREVTGGRGVDIVFNSLAGDFITRSFDVLAPNGRFVEIGKRDIWSKAKAAQYRPDVGYEFFEIGEDTTSGGIGDNSVIHDLMVTILEDFERGRLKPLAMTEFPVVEVQQAYRYLSAGKNIGKVVVNFDAQRGSDDALALVRANRSYLVTGGLGGLGFLCADWLIAHGAKHVALAGRREPSPEVARKIADYNKVGVEVYAVRGDIGRYDDAARIVREISAGKAPLGGVLHCAGVLQDALLEQQDEQKFAAVFAPKVDGALNLHRLTRDLALDFFVSFSSTSAVLDGGGQANYAAANAFMDRLMSYRRSHDLPGLSINWGAWADVGMAAELAERRAMDVSHFISKDEALAAMERLLQDRSVQRVVCKLGARLASSRHARVLLHLEQQAQAGVEEVGDLERLFTQNPNNSAELNFELFLKAQVNKVLGVGAAEEVAADLEFVALGVDSLSMTELKNAVAHGLGKSLKMATFFAHPTVARLAAHLTKEYAGQLTFVPSARGTEPGAAPAVANAKPSSLEFVMLEPSEAERILFCFPGLNGSVFDFADFTAESKAKFKVMVGELGSELATLETNIRVLAADAIRQMQRTQPRGPYSLLGYSYGGVVALEIAHQLRAAGAEVDMLMMVDSFPHFHFRDDQRFMNFMAALIVDSILAPMKLDAATYDRLAVQLMQTPGEELRALLEQSDGGADGVRVNLDLLDGIVEAGKKRSLANYLPPRRIDGVRIDYVRAGAYPRSMRLAELGGFLEEAAMCDEKYQWQRFVENEFSVRWVDAQHNEILKSRHAPTILGFVEDAMRIGAGSDAVSA
ncbi:MAG: SDR family NAD(P)-dependent oxidoreductase [Rhodanobacteraceae bacterium]|nr:SDR family NAD(P)-dependent oxidoreductase [Rhodanobacteraceae bacterium]